MWKNYETGGELCQILLAVLKGKVELSYLLFFPPPSQINIFLIKNLIYWIMK